MIGSFLALAAVAHPVPFEQHQAACAGKDGWSDPAPPIRLFANVYDVGTCGLVVLLITGLGFFLLETRLAARGPVASRKWPWP